MHWLCTAFQGSLLPLVLWRLQQLPAESSHNTVTKDNWTNNAIPCNQKHARQDLLCIQVGPFLHQHCSTTNTIKVQHTTLLQVKNQPNQHSRTAQSSVSSVLRMDLLLESF
jgi:hypothetical protein